jgi:hypothetical protein
MRGRIMTKKTLKIKIKRMQNSDIFTDYCRVFKIFAFRYHLLKNIIMDTAADITVMMDTNQRREDSSVLLDEDWLKQMNLRYVIVPAKKNDVQFFGVKISKFSKNIKFTEKRMLFDLPRDAFSEQLFEKLKNCDIAIGFGRKKPFEEICEYWKHAGEDILFDDQLFQDCLYDSVLCARMRSTFSTERYLKAIADEMGL